MRRLGYLLTFLLCVPVTGLAATTVCTVSGDMITPKYIAWDTVTRVAKFSYLGDVAVGRLTLVSKGANGNDVFNFAFTIVPKSWKMDEVEVLVHQPEPKQFVVIAVGYKIIRGKKYLSSTLGLHDATCITL